MILENQIIRRKKDEKGYKKYNNMNSVVTSGVGLYGPNMRIGTKAEVVTINVHFNKS